MWHYEIDFDISTHHDDKNDVITRYRSRNSDVFILPGTNEMVIKYTECDIIMLNRA